MQRGLLGAPAGRAAVGAVALLAVGVLVGLAALWPSGTVAFSGMIPVSGEEARAEAVAPIRCLPGLRPPCQRVVVRLLSGRDETRTAPIVVSGNDVPFAVRRGDGLRVASITGRTGVDPRTGTAPYAFVGFERRSTLLGAALVLALLVIALARWKGVRSLAGLVLSLALVTQFVVPAILRGESPLLVALVGAMAIMLVTVGLTHGAGIVAIAAVLGAAVSLLLTALLAVRAVELAHVTGFGAEQSALLQPGSSSVQVSLVGLVVAGMVIGALGVLDDVTVSQASTVMALRRANARLGVRRLVSEGMAVGRDHLAATVNTLVLAYAGAALPLLLIFELQAVSVADALNQESVTVEILAMCVGSIGLIAALPLTTALAAVLATRLPESDLPAEDHGHHH